MKLRSTNSLHIQLVDFISHLQTANKKRSLPRNEKDFTYIIDFFERVIADRNERADDIDSEEYKKSLEIARELLPFPTNMEGCMDGRLFGPLVGIFGHVGDWLTVAGGILHEFVINEDDQRLYLLPHSNFAELLRDHLDKQQAKEIFEIFDSHLGCAAREAEEIAKGKYPTDHGLLADVLHKKEMNQAIGEYIQKEYHGKKYVSILQISLDPHTGFLYMGLGTDAALKRGIEHGGFTQEVLDELVQKNIIISTEVLSEEKQFQNIFEKHAFRIDLKHAYKESALQLWKAIGGMQGDLMPYLYEKLYKVYPHLKNDPKEKKELQERASILLVNAFIGFLHQKYYPTYPYSIHREEGVYVRKGATTPYRVDMFGVSSLDMDNLANNIELSSSLVRANRKTGRVEDASKLFDDIKDFVSAPVGVIMQVKVLQELTKAEWDEVSSINWDHLEHISWDTMTDWEFFEYLEKKNKDLSIAVANAINKLRTQMAVLYDVDREISSHIVENDSIVLPILADTSRRIRCIIPFLKIGYHS